MLCDQAISAIGEASTGTRPWRRVFSFPVVLAALLVVLTMFTIRSRFNDPDLWWHLKTGELIWNTHSIPRVDSFSFTVAGHSRPPQEWLSELTMYTAWKLAGYTGLMVWFCIFASLLVISAYVLCALYSGNVKLAFLGGLVVFWFSTVGLGVRPHMIGYLLLICEILVVRLAKTRNPRWLFLLPPMFWLWVNVHSSFIFGLWVLSILFVCSFLELQWGLLVSQRWERHRRKVLTIAFVLSVAAVFTNPVGVRQITYPVVAMSNMPLSLHTVSEWLPPSFEQRRGVALLLIGGFTLLIPILRRTELLLDELLLVGTGFGFAVRHERMLFVFGILVAPVLCRLLSDTLSRYEPSHDPVLPNLIILALLVPVIILTFPTRRSLEQQVENENPVRAVEFLKHSGLSGRMLNQYSYGGYLIWVAPEHKVFIDGRADVFEWAGVFADYVKLISLSVDPRTLLEKYHINVCFLSRDQALGRILPLLSGWKIAYSDNSALILTKSGAR